MESVWGVHLACRVLKECQSQSEECLTESASRVEDVCVCIYILFENLENLFSYYACIFSVKHPTVSLKVVT